MSMKCGISHISHVITDADPALSPGSAVSPKQHVPRTNGHRNDGQHCQEVATGRRREGDLNTNGSIMVR